MNDIDFQCKMNNNILINEIFTDIEAGKFEKANAILSDNFRRTLLGKEVNWKFR